MRASWAIHQAARTFRTAHAAPGIRPARSITAHNTHDDPNRAGHTVR